MTGSFNKAFFGLSQRLVPTAEFMGNPSVWCVDILKTYRYSCQEQSNKRRRLIMATARPSRSPRRFQAGAYFDALEVVTDVSPVGNPNDSIISAIC
jgi:hypothetical protein